MTVEELNRKLFELCSMQAENEVVEFKTAKESFDFQKLGKYFSALSNEANLKSKNEAWLVFGVENTHKKIVGSNYRINNRALLDNLKSEIANKTTNRITFIEIYELFVQAVRVVMFQIPPAPRGIPIAWEGHYYGREDESLNALNIEEFERIRKQATQADWSAVICDNASLDDLDPQAINKARENYKNKFPEQSDLVNSWSDETFLNKAKITIRGKITRAAVLLLGKPESEHFISPAEAKIRWILKDNHNTEKDYAIFNCPFILNVDDVYRKIRNLKYRYIRDNSLFPEEVDQYEPFLIREALHNCIAHQDYSIGGRVNVIEKEDELVFTNGGEFIPGTIENVIQKDAPEERYRNPFLVTAMFTLNMVDTIGSGIRRMFNFQRSRFFPMPEYDLSDNRVKVTIIGKVLDSDFAKALLQNPDLSLEEIIMLDKVQKRKELLPFEVEHLKQKGLVEGRKPNLHISANVAASTGQSVDYMKTRGIDDAFIRKTIIDYLEKFGDAKREVFEKILFNKLSEGLSDNQKRTKIKHTLQAMKKEGVIASVGKKWTISNSGA
ncbi:MAG: putative DNA binding domain-containing protein [Ignavibacteriaceae bacterium]|nr:putative DNA binding domain-containing protein [Ignavibacteriaceae bacterium]